MSLQCTHAYTQRERETDIQRETEGDKERQNCINRAVNNERPSSVDIDE